jgi:hypothetical protein
MIRFNGEDAFVKSCLPKHRRDYAVPCHRDHQDVDRDLAKILVRPIDRQNPWLATEPQQFDNHVHRRCSRQIMP